ncbi:hypothetical protein [Vibrio phage VpV262]|uniref:HNH endonuclease n=1 Tax=Vibrio phage VpV262 TaxID=2907796 RepID=Q8LT70_9CAUD|nr:HNH endonuclease [Vibrio phage VpV262]AAM28382.1 hypothetical protein [Vibrio phage VpV262]
MANGKPWEDAPDLWKDETAFMSKFCRSGIRKIWSRHPIKHRYCASRVAVAVEKALEEGYPIGVKLSPRTKKLRSCEICEQWFPVSHLQVDHLDGGYGFKTKEEMIAWMTRQLWIGFDDIREICKGCHEKVNTMQRYDCTWEEVPMYQAFAEFKQKKAGPQRKLLSKLGLPDGSNATQREAIYWDYLKENQDG